MKFLKSTPFYLGLLVVLTIPLCLGLFNSHLINGHDSMGGLIRALSMQKYMGHGQLLVRWSPEINWGYGYPMFNFYPPLFSFISVMIFQVTQNMPLAINWACILFWVLSGIGMFLFAREFWGNEGGMLSALLYVYAPYHITDLYVRGAFAEFSSFAFFPFLLFSILKISRNAPWGYFLLGIASVFGLSLAHNIMSMLFFPVAVVFMLYLFFLENNKTWISIAVGMFVIGLMMSAFFWLPALIEKRFLNLDFLLTKHFDYHENYISLKKLFWPIHPWSMDHIYFQVGLLHSLLCIFTLACIPKIFRINRPSGFAYVFFLCVGLSSIFFTLPYSHVLWEHIPILGFIQFPWRILTIIVFTMSFLSGSALLLIRHLSPRIIALIVIGLVSMTVYLNSTVKPKFLDNSQSTTEDSIGNFLALGDGEYTPKWVGIPPEKRPDRKFEIAQGKGQLGDEKALNPVDYDVKLQALEPSLICFHSFYFPGWRVYIDGQATRPYLKNPFGLILFYAPSGDHDIEVVFGPTPVRAMSVVISWIGVFLSLAGTLLWRFTFLAHTKRNKNRVV